MQIGAIAWWQLIGMFGLGVGAGPVIGLLAIKMLFKPDRSDWWAPLKALFLVLFVAAVCSPLAGIAAVVLTFAAHHTRLDGTIPYLAGIGLCFLALLAATILWHLCTRAAIRKRRSREAGRSKRIVS